MLITILNRSIGNKNKVFFNSLNLNWQTCASNGRSKKKVKSRWCNIVRHWFYVLLHHRKLIFFRDTKKKTMARFLAANIDDFETIHFSLQMRRCKKKRWKKKCDIVRHLRFRYSASSSSSKYENLFFRNAIQVDESITFFVFSSSSMPFKKRKFENVNIRVSTVPFFYHCHSIYKVLRIFLSVLLCEG